MLDILIWIFWIWLFIFAINVPLFIGDLKDLNEEYGSIVKTSFIALVGLWVIFLRGPLATWEKIVEWWALRQTKKHLKRIMTDIATKQKAETGSVDPTVEEILKDIEEL